MSHQYLITSDIATWTLRGQQVILRADLNVPVDHDQILDTFRLEALLPTLELLCTKDATIHLITHYDQSLNSPITDLLTRWFAYAGYRSPRLHIHENLRLSPKEKCKDHLFAQTLARGMQWYIDDAFGTLHRSDTSLTILPRYFPQNHRSIGLLVERELAHLVPLITSPQRPYGLLLGGGKIATKLPYIIRLLSHVDYVFICPNIASLFIPSQSDRFPQDLIDLANSMLSHQYATKLFLPTDYLVSTAQHTYQYKSISEITQDDTVIAIGPDTVSAWLPYLSSLATIVCNGPMGFAAEPITRSTLQQLLDHINSNIPHIIIGGGDMTLAVHTLIREPRIEWHSTGGGSLLALLSGSPLPALDALSQPEIEE